MQSNIEEHGLTKTKRTLMERIRIFGFARRDSIFMYILGLLCFFAVTITDSRRFMIAMHTISFCMTAVCLWAAFKTGRYGYYFASAAIIAGLSCLWPKFTTRAMDKWRTAMDEQRKRD